MDWCEQAEAQALARATVVSAVSDADLARLCPPGCGHRNLVAPNGVDDHLLGCPPGPGPDATGRNQGCWPTSAGQEIPGPSCCSSARPTPRTTRPRIGWPSWRLPRRTFWSSWPAAIRTGNASAP